MQERRQGENRQVSPYFSFALRSKEASLREESAVVTSIQAKTLGCATRRKRPKMHERGLSLRA